MGIDELKELTKGINKVYISGPMKDVEDYKMIFDKAEQKLRACGFDVFNPAWMGYGDKWKRNEMLAIDAYIMCHCDAIYFLKGWEDAMGCMLEHSWAECHKIPDITKIIDGYFCRPEWVEIDMLKDDPDISEYQHSKHTSVFKTVNKESGETKFTDVNRIVNENVDRDFEEGDPYVWNDLMNHACCGGDYSFGLTRKIIDILAPIDFYNKVNKKDDYVPGTPEYRVYNYMFLTDKENGDFDTVHIIATHNMIHDLWIPINLYFKCDKYDKDFVRITKEEYVERRNREIDRYEG